MTDVEESAARAAFRALPSTFGLPACRVCFGAGRLGKRLHAGCYDLTTCTACNGRGVVEVP